MLFQRTHRFFVWSVVLVMSLLLVSSASALQGGDNGYGYHYIDSLEKNGPQYEYLALDEKGERFVDLTKRVSDITLTQGYPIGFNFEFYGKKYNYFYISGNGYITFEFRGDTTSYKYEGQNLPSKQMPNTIIAPLWSHNNIET